MSDLATYLRKRGAKPVTGEALREYDRKMRDEVIPKIEADLRAQRRAAHYARLGIDPPEGQRS